MSAKPFKCGSVAVSWCHEIVQTPPWRMSDAVSGSESSAPSDVDAADRSSMASPRALRPCGHRVDDDRSVAGVVEFVSRPVSSRLANKLGPAAPVGSVVELAERLTALLRVAGTHPDAGDAVSGLLDSTVLRALTARIDDGETAEFRAALVATQLAGLALLRLVIPLPALADASIDDLVTAIAPTIERYLEDDLRPDR